MTFFPASVKQEAASSITISLEYRLTAPRRLLALGSADLAEAPEMVVAMPTRQRSSIDHTAMREMNLALILNALRRHAPCSRADLVDYTRLNKASISNMVRDLLDRDLICESGPNSLPNAEVGRPGINLRLNPAAGHIIGAEIGVDFMSIVVANFAFEVVARRYETTAHLRSSDAVIAWFIDHVRELIVQSERQSRPLLGIAVGVPGLVDMDSGRLLYAPNLDWHDLPLGERLSAAFGQPVLVVNEANMAAFGESYFRPAQQGELLLYVSSGIGLGGGIVIDGVLLTGASGFAGEFGHMTVNVNGISCRCGNRGCWETEATEAALIRRVRSALEDGQPSSLAPSGGREQQLLSVERIVTAARGGDRVARSAIEETGRWLGIGLANLLNALNPDQVVLGGKLSIAFDMMMPVIQREIEARALLWVRQRARLALAQHVADACVMGGIAMIHHQIITHPLRWSRVNGEKG